MYEFNASCDFCPKIKHVGNNYYVKLPQMIQQ